MSCVKALKWPEKKQDGNGGEGFVLMDRWRVDKTKKKRKTWLKRKERQERDREWMESENMCCCQSVFNPFGFFLPPFPTFSVLIDKHREGMGPRD